MPRTDKPDLPAAPELAEPAAKPWWAELLQGLATPPQSVERPVWNAEVREFHRSGVLAIAPPASFYPLRTFYGCLGEELDQAKRHGQTLTVVVLQLPDPASPAPSRRQLRDQETALRLSVRCGDLPTRLSPTTLAVALPRCETHAGGVVLRLQRLLAPVVGGKVVSGVACFPGDGSTALELLRAAAWRSMSGLPRTQPDPELTRLLGPLGPREVPQPST
jgi:hypothetical protein